MARVARWRGREGSLLRLSARRLLCAAYVQYGCRSHQTIRNLHCSVFSMMAAGPFVLEALLHCTHGQAGGAGTAAALSWSLALNACCGTSGRQWVPDTRCNGWKAGSGGASWQVLVPRRPVATGRMDPQRPRAWRRSTFLVPLQTPWQGSALLATQHCDLRICRH